jgi:endonuclease/exonuclease/phosphatase (EEP) superfamily protein YafD
MSKQSVQSATALPASPEAERRTRMLKYSVTMGIRIVCFIVLILMPRSWWMLIPLAGAVILPYLAVVVANTVVRTAAPVERPGAIEPVVTHPGQSGPRP